MPGAKQRLAEQRRLLVAGDRPRSECRAREELAGGLAVDSARRAHLGQQLRAARRAVAAARRPSRRVADVEEQRARGVADVGDVRRAARSASRRARNRPCRTRARPPRPSRARPARCRASTRSWCRRSRRRAPARSSRGTSARGRARLSASQIGGGAPVLPDDRVGDRLAGRAIPDDGGLALVGDADRGDVARARCPARASASPATAICVAQISSGSCSTQPGCGKIWRNSFCATARIAPVVVEHDGARTGRALIEREDHAFAFAMAAEGLYCGKSHVNARPFMGVVTPLESLLSSRTKLV